MNSTKELIVSLLITIIAVGAYLYAFIFADRTGIFLYEHLGAGPFDPLTTGRYWMLGFVVAGFITLACFIILMILKFSGQKITLDWKTIAKLTTIPLFTSSIIITKLGQPPLPYSLAISSAFTLTFAVLTGISFINDLITKWLPTVKHAIIVIGFIPFGIFFRVLELPQSEILSKKTAVFIVASVYVFAVVWMDGFKWIFRNLDIKATGLIKSIIVMAYIGLPVLHYLMTVAENHPYITSSDIFFTSNIFLRFTNWAIIILTIYGIKKPSITNSALVNRKR